MTAYYQITACFRDEDLRADRQPEFTQIDIETSFMEEQDIRDLTQEMIKTVFQNTLGVDLGEFPGHDLPGCGLTALVRTSPTCA